MLRNCVKRSLFCVLWPFNSITDDVVTGKTKTEQKVKDEIKSYSKAETGWERVKTIFKKK